MTTAESRSKQAQDAERDIVAYMRAMMMPNGWSMALQIERRWGLDGYPPQIVATALHLISQGVSPEDAETRALGQETS